MTPEQFKKEVEALGLTVVQHDRRGGRTMFPYIAELGGVADVFHDDNINVTVWYEYADTRTKWKNVRSAVECVLKHKDPILAASIMEKMK